MSAAFEDNDGRRVSVDSTIGHGSTEAMYFAHTQSGVSLRELARQNGLHPSTVLRRIRKVEDRREDPLVDEYYSEISEPKTSKLFSERLHKTMTNSYSKPQPSAEEFRILRRLSEKEAFLAISSSLENGVVLRKIGKGAPTRTAVVKRDIAKALVVRDWISITNTGKVNTYIVTEAGRAALRREILREGRDVPDDAGFAEQPSPFAGQHRAFGTRAVMEQGSDKPRKIRVNLRESPLTMLGRKKERGGKPFLSHELVQAGEQLREDFELAQIGPRVAQNWDRFLTAGGRGQFDSGAGEGSSAARKRLQLAVTALGPGLSDIAVRCCCFLEGLEAAEKRMGWSARSGKVVLRIALQRLRLHYEEVREAKDVRKIG